MIRDKDPAAYLVYVLSGLILCCFSQSELSGELDGSTPSSIFDVSFFHF